MMGSGHTPRHAGYSLALAVGCAALAPNAAGATEVRTVSQTIGEGYSVRIPGADELLLRRRRLVQYVNLGVLDMLPPKLGETRRDAEDGQLRLMTSMRLRHDFGDYLRDGSDVAAGALQSVDGRQIDLLFGYLEGVRLARWIDFRLGRQFEMSGLDWYAFDGAWIRAHTPAYFAVEVFSGLQVDGQQVFGYPTVELDGTAGTAEDRGYRWMIGTALSASGISWLDARVAWRRTWSPEALNANISADDGTQGLAGAINQDLVSASVAGLAFGGRLTPYAALRYNLGTSRLDDVTFGVQAAITERHTIRALYLRTNPSFDLDSVFNLFTFEPIDDARLVYEVRPGKRWTLAARGQMRLFSNAATAEGLAPEGAVEAGFGGGASAQFRIPRFAARVDGYGLGGEGGVRAGGSIDTRTMVAWDRLGIDARVYGNYYDDVDALARRGYGLAFQAGLNARLWRGIHLALLGEELLSTHYTQAFRLLATLSIEWSTRFGR